MMTHWSREIRRLMGVERGQTISEVASILAVILMLTVGLSYFIAHDANVIFSKVAAAMR